MASKFKKNIGKNSIVAIFLFSVIFGSSAPVFTPRAEAFLGGLLGGGGGLPVVDTHKWIKDIIDGLAMALAHAMVDRIVQSTITWANSGFDGNPAFVTDPKSYFGNIANGVAGDFINKAVAHGNLCSPFQAKIVLALRQTYTQTYQPQCTLTGIVANIDNFYKDFSQGGWDAWFSMTQNSSNNPYGAYLDASNALNTAVDAAVNLQTTKLNWSSGFKSKGDCVKRNGSPSASSDSETPANINHVFTEEQQNNPDYNSAYAPGACIQYGPDKTPGVVIKDQLNKVLPSGLEQLISVQQLDQLVNAFANGLLQRYVFGNKGLFSNNYSDSYNANNSGTTGSTPSPSATSTPATPPQGIACLADPKNAQVEFTPVFWVRQGDLADAKYTWNLGPEANIVDTGPNFVAATYHTAGTYGASLTATYPDSRVAGITLRPPVTVECSNEVEISDSTSGSIQ